MDRAPAAPEGLSEAGRACWGLTWAAAGAWLVPESDGPVVERYARLTDEAAELRQAIAERGREARGSQGQPVTAPAVGQLRQVEQLLLKHEQVLGLGPANRARLGLAVLQVEEKADLVAKMREKRIAAANTRRNR